MMTRSEMAVLKWDMPVPPHGSCFYLSLYLQYSSLKVRMPGFTTKTKENSDEKEDQKDCMGICNLNCVRSCHDLPVNLDVFCHV